MARTFTIHTPAGESGPFTARQLKELADTGRLDKGSLVQPSDREQAFRAGDIPGLFSDRVVIPNSEEHGRQSRKHWVAWKWCVLSFTGIVVLALSGRAIYFAVLNYGSYPEQEVAAIHAQSDPDNDSPFAADHSLSQPSVSVHDVQDDAEHNNDIAQRLLSVDLAWVEFPDGFSGHDPLQIYHGLDQVLGDQRGKGAYETEQQHHDRIQSAFETEYLPGISTQDRLAVPIMRPEYDPEKQFFHWRYFGNKPSFMLNSEVLDTYTATNAFGVRVHVTVNATEYVEFHLDGIPIGDLALRGYSPTPFQMDPQDAQAVHRHLKAFAIGRIVHPYLLPASVSTSEPTIRSPHKTTDRRNIVPFFVDEIWVVRLDTNEILHRMNPAEEYPRQVLNAVRNKLSQISAVNDLRVAENNFIEPFGASVAFDLHSEEYYQLDLAWNGSGFDIVSGSVTQRTLGTVDLNLKQAYAGLPFRVYYAIRVPN